MRRGEIWWADLDPPVGRRPVLLLSRDRAYVVRTSITVAPVTRTIHGIPAEVELDQRDGMLVKCVVDLDDIATIRKSTLAERLTTLSTDKMREVSHAIVFALALGE